MADAGARKTLDEAAASARAAGLMRDGLCCSESLLIAVGEQVAADFDRSWVRLASGLCGGVGRSREEMCGALAGGVMVIGLLHGRDRAGQDITHCAALAKEWREAFAERFGSTRCRPIYDRVQAQGGSGSCADVTGEAAALLVALLKGG